MPHPTTSPRWQTDGKFFRCGDRRIRPRMVTYGPFPGGWPARFGADFERIADAGFSAIRIYQLPDLRLLHAAEKAGIKVVADLDWEQNSDFLGNSTRFTAAKLRLASWLREYRDHPVLVAVHVGNEIPVDLVRWMGPERVRAALEELIQIGREAAPGLLFGYANFPSTEYLEPGNADFTAFNIYLEQEASLENYLRRLHHVAGDRPLVVSEFGLDSLRNGAARQAELLENAALICEDGDAAGFTVFSWSDRWLSGGIEVDDWAFGITDRDGRDKPAVASLAGVHGKPETARPAVSTPAVSAIVCTRNGRRRIGNCLRALENSNCDRPFEIVVVDDGSTDGTSEFVAREFPNVRLLRIEPRGLSAARNEGAEEAQAGILAFTDDDCEPDRDWLRRAAGFLGDHPGHAAVGGPNLPQRPGHWREAVVCAAPGAPSHVMLDDVSAEHLPGCNLVVRKSAWRGIGGFDEQFHTAGDDVDFCWRLQDAGETLGFAPGAFVWHWRRPSLRAYLRQQIGYGKAERLLIAKHPNRFSKAGAALWKGTIYDGSPVRAAHGAIIYHGPVDQRTYHPELSAKQPLRDLDDRFNGLKARIALQAIIRIAPAIRAWHRTRCLISLLPRESGKPAVIPPADTDEWFIDGISRDPLISLLLKDGWKPCGGSDPWDLERNGTRILIATELGEKGARKSLVRVDRPGVGGQLPLVGMKHLI